MWEDKTQGEGGQQGRRDEQVWLCQYPPTQPIFPSGAVRGICACSFRPHQALRGGRPVLCGGGVRACATCSLCSASRVGESVVALAAAIEGKSAARPIGSDCKGMWTKRRATATGHREKRRGAATRGSLGRRRVLDGRQALVGPPFFRIAVCGARGR